MIIIEVLANKIADQIAIQLNLDKEKRSVIAYGLIGLLQGVFLIAVITIIGLTTDSFYESMIIFFIVGFMRKSTGGAHSKTMGGCNAVSVLSIAVLALTSRYLLNIPINRYLNLGITLVVFITAFIIFYLRVPVDSPHKPIISSEKIKRLRKESFIKLLVFFLISIVVIMLTDAHERLNSIVASLKLALIWQTMTLTEVGISLLSSLDHFVSRILDKLKIV